MASKIDIFFKTIDMDKKKKKVMVAGLKRGTLKQIAKALGCCPDMVSHAIRGRKNTPLALKIRYIAVKEYGGKEVEFDV